MSDSNDVPTEEVTVKAEKPKDPKRIAWGKKLGEKNKGSKRKKTEEAEESKETNSIIYFAPVALVAVGVAVYVLYYSKPSETMHETTHEIPQTQKKKKKLNLEL